MYSSVNFSVFYIAGVANAMSKPVPIIGFVSCASLD